MWGSIFQQQLCVQFWFEINIAFWSKECGQHLFRALETYTKKWSPQIMSTESRALVDYEDRERPVLNEMDLERNFELVKEVLSACLEFTLVLNPSTDQKEIPFLAEFEAWIHWESWTNIFHLVAYASSLSWDFLSPFLLTLSHIRAGRPHCCWYPWGAISMLPCITNEEGRARYANLWWQNVWCNENAYLHSTI